MVVVSGDGGDSGDGVGVVMVVVMVVVHGGDDGGASGGGRKGLEASGEAKRQARG